MREILILTEQRFAKLNVSLDLKLTEGLGVHAQPEKLQQIILNLIVNAVFAIEQAVKEGRKVGHKLQIKSFSDGDTIQLAITDTGCGIAEENLTKLFQPFFTTRPEGQGTGLGLPIVQELLEELRGSIEVKSVVNTGTCFTLKFPSRPSAKVYDRESVG